MEYKVFSGGKGGGCQVTIPKRLAEALGLAPGGRVRWEIGPGRSLVLRPVKDGGEKPDGQP
jgi:antitoxin component of MazEF toxin-antitoxin module